MQQPIGPAVKNYLHSKCHLPLHATVYGQTEDQSYMGGLVSLQILPACVM